MDVLYVFVVFRVLRFLMGVVIGSGESLIDSIINDDPAVEEALAIARSKAKQFPKQQLEETQRVLHNWRTKFSKQPEAPNRIKQLEDEIARLERLVPQPPSKGNGPRGKSVQTRESRALSRRSKSHKVGGPISPLPYRQTY